MKTTEQDLLLSHFPELVRQDLKTTHHKQWVKFLNLFDSLCRHVHDPSKMHKFGLNDEFTFPQKTIRSHVGMPNRLFFDLYNALSDYVQINEHYVFAKSKSSSETRKWRARDEFYSRSKMYLREKADMLSQSSTKSAKNQFSARADAVALSSDDNAVRNVRLETEYTQVNGFSTIKYTDSDCGRLFTPMQHLSKDLRSIVFKGMHEYDIQAAGPTIITGIARKHCPAIMLPGINAYINAAQSTRQVISDDTGIDLNVVKGMINGIFFGMHVPTGKQAKFDHYENKNAEKFMFSMHNSVGVKNSNILRKHPVFKELASEIDLVRSVVSDNLKQSTQRINGKWYIMNSAGKVKVLDRWSAASVVSHLYFGYERNILDVVVSSVPAHEVLLMHDGFISINEVQVKELEKKILDQTGLQVTYIHKVI